MKTIKKIMNIVACILFCCLFVRCSYKIQTIKEIIYGQEGFDTIVPARYKPFLTKKQIKEFENGQEVLDSHFFRIYHRNGYRWISDSILVKCFDGYFYTDGNVGVDTSYYSNGHIEHVENYILMNDSTKKIISMEDFNKIKDKRDNGNYGYYGHPNGIWKYYSKDGKLVKEEIYDKGKLEKTITY